MELYFAELVGALQLGFRKRLQLGCILLFHVTVFSHKQVLFDRPIRMELSPEDEVVASMHMDLIRFNNIIEQNKNKIVFPFFSIILGFLSDIYILSKLYRKNGFVVALDANAPPGNQFLLKAVPFSKNVTFGAEGNPVDFISFSNFYRKLGTHWQVNNYFSQLMIL